MFIAIFTAYAFKISVSLNQSHFIKAATKLQKLSLKMVKKLISHEEFYAFPKFLLNSLIFYHKVSLSNSHFQIFELNFFNVHTKKCPKEKGPDEKKIKSCKTV